MEDVVVLSACRTAIGKFAGTLKDVPVQELGALVVKEVVQRAAWNRPRCRNASWATCSKRRWDRTPPGRRR